MCNEAPYVFDSCSFIDLFRDFCGRDISVPLWEKFDALVRKKRITSVREVFHELTKFRKKCKKDQLGDWAEKHGIILFTEPSERELDLVVKVDSLYPKLSYRKTKEEAKKADPFLIAKAKNISGCVVTGDGHTQKGKIKEKEQIALVCKKMNVQCITLTRFMVQENLNFLTTATL